MNYRPQFAFSTPKGFTDEQFHYSFDGTNTPGLAAAIPAGGILNNVVLQMQNDAEFVLRALKIQLGTAVSNLNLQIRDPYGYYLSAADMAIATYLSPAGAALVGSLFTVFESEIIAPAGGFFEVFFQNLTTGSVNPPAFTFYGVKRYQECAA